MNLNRKSFQQNLNKSNSNNKTPKQKQETKTTTTNGKNNNKIKKKSLSGEFSKLILNYQNQKSSCIQLILTLKFLPSHKGLVMRLRTLSRKQRRHQSRNTFWILVDIFHKENIFFQNIYQQVDLPLPKIRLLNL